MADFTHFYPHLLRAEGGYCHVAGDAGGETWQGIARVFHPSWPGWPLVELAKHRLQLRSPVPATRWAALNRALAADAALARLVQTFYKQGYWDALRLDTFASQAVAEQLADHGVNAGLGRPPRLLQYALQRLAHPTLAEDGQLGPLTLRAANATPAPALWQALVELRQQFYRFRAGQLSLASSDPLAGLFSRLHLRPDASQAKFLSAWLARIAALPAA